MCSQSKTTSSLTSGQTKAKDHLSGWKVGALFMEAGTGKTRVAVEIVRRSPCDACFWIGALNTIRTREGVPSVKDEVGKWGGMGIPTTYTGIESIQASDRLWLGLLVFLLVLGGSGYWYYVQFPSGNKKPQLSDEELAQRVSMLTMRNVRQYYVQNEKIGKVCVIVGDVRNEFPQPKALIRVEAAIYDKNRKPLAVKQQLAGSQLSLFQLQVLGEKELESFLQSSTDIYIRNSNVPPGGEVPFMVLFYAPSDAVAEFGVRMEVTADRRHGFETREDFRKQVFVEVGHIRLLPCEDAGRPQDDSGPQAD